MLVTRLLIFYQYLLDGRLYGYLCDGFFPQGYKNLEEWVKKLADSAIEYRKQVGAQDDAIEIVESRKSTDDVSFAWVDLK